METVLEKPKPSEIPKNAAFTLTVPLDRNGKEATFHIKDIDEPTFMATKSLIEANKQFDAVRLVIKTLWVAGDDPVLLKDNFVAVSAAAKLVLELVEPLKGELKKN